MRRSKNPRSGRKRVAANSFHSSSENNDSGFSSIKISREDNSSSIDVTSTCSSPQSKREKLDTLSASLKQYSIDRVLSAWKLDNDVEWPVPVGVFQGFGCNNLVSIMAPFANHYVSSASDSLSDYNSSVEDPEMSLGESSGRSGSSSLGESIESSIHRRFPVTPIPVRPLSSRILFPDPDDSEVSEPFLVIDDEPNEAEGGDCPDPILCPRVSDELAQQAITFSFSFYEP